MRERFCCRALLIGVLHTVACTHFPQPRLLFVTSVADHVMFD